MSSVDPDVLLANYRIVLEPGDTPATENTFKLMDDEEIFRMLDAFGHAIRSPERKVTGSLFIKRYSALAAGALYAWIHHGCGLDVSLNRLAVTVEASGALRFHIADACVHEDCTADGERLWTEEEAGRTEAYLVSVFTTNVVPVFDSVIRYSDIPSSTLWSTLSYLFIYWKRKWLEQASSVAMRMRIEEVYGCLMSPVNTSFFDGCPVNPLTPSFRTIEDPLHSGCTIMLRSKCCMNYRLPGEDRYCYTCPAISDERKIEKYLAAHMVAQK
ncbi:IucA/IucC family C-terminal-domain containing protein [Paenibacillus chartarius]|uniref:IucA/IucC family C-terminal-domain containing protein n=1 Tax=Paenibacillus chartarius TaxID=747481 RepID=A0ABV6DGB4_9BACL